MMNFCTLYDSNYISKGLALYLSLMRYTDDFTMYVMAMDRKCQEILDRLSLPHIIIECLEDNMSEELVKAKGNRSRAEFCWTCGSYITHLFIKKYNLADITYLDSDLMFFSSPKVIFDELESKHASVGLSPHFIPYNASGKYCVQFCYFKNDKDGMDALTWWKDETLKWCYSKMEDGKYGDQMYLEYMPGMFHNVCDIENRGAGLAYWNEFAYRFTDTCVIYKHRQYPFVFYHYSGFNVSWDNGKIVTKEHYEIKNRARDLFVKPYLQLLREVYNDYLHQTVNAEEYIKCYGFKDRIMHWTIRRLENFDIWHRIKRQLILRKYSAHFTPYSERKSTHGGYSLRNKSKK